MFIKKFRLISENPTENEFETTRTRKTNSIMSIRSITDDEGNVISANRVIPPTIKNNITEEITAVSIPSRTPARVEILETIDDQEEISNTETVNDSLVKKEKGPIIMKGPQRQKPITLDKLQGREKPIVVQFPEKTNSGDIEWV
jgi:hypothetical protein